MNCEKSWNVSRYTWSPYDQKGVDHYTLRRYLCEKMGEEWGAWWMGEMDRVSQEAEKYRGSVRRDCIDRFIWNICKYDAAEMVELLYPIAPELFLNPRSMDGGWGDLNAVARCAQLGSLACLETLLELGADPDGLDCPTGWNTMPVLGGGCYHIRSSYVTPLDCAMAEEQEECALMLRMHGGQTIRELLGMGTIEQLYCQLGWQEIPCSPELSEG